MKKDLLSVMGTGMLITGEEKLTDVAGDVRRNVYGVRDYTKSLLNSLSRMSDLVKEAGKMGRPTMMTLKYIETISCEMLNEISVLQKEQKTDADKKEAEMSMEILERYQGIIDKIRKINKHDKFVKVMKVLSEKYEGDVKLISKKIVSDWKGLDFELKVLGGMIEWLKYVFFK